MFVPQVDPGNVQLMEQHVSCAAVEAPVVPADAAFFGDGLAATMRSLEKKGASDSPASVYFATLWKRILACACSMLESRPNGADALPSRYIVPAECSPVA